MLVQSKQVLARKKELEKGHGVWSEKGGLSVRVVMRLFGLFLEESDQVVAVFGLL
jgi:hypothetical protein